MYACMVMLLLSAEVKEIPLWPVETEMLKSVNIERQRHGLELFVIDEKVQTTCRNHCYRMALYHSFNHGNDGVAENIAMGQPDVDSVTSCWMRSSGHFANIMNSRHRRIGVAGYKAANGTIYWCQQFTP